MFYVLMAFCAGAVRHEAAQFIQRKTAGRINLGPATFNTILENLRRKNIWNKSSGWAKTHLSDHQRGRDAYQRSCRGFAAACRMPRAKGAIKMRTDPDQIRHAWRFPPCPAYDVEGTESWLSDMAAQGLVLGKDAFLPDCDF